MASNQSTLSDEDGDFPDWIELYNPGPEPINLGSWYISDNIDDLIKWIFPDISIEANGYLVLFASGKDRRAKELHTNFKLSSLGENIFLTLPDGSTIAFSFINQYPEQFPDISYGFVQDELIYLDLPTPGSANIVGGYLSPPSFSVAHGFYADLFHLRIQSSISGSSIKYTIDGSEPDLVNGTEFIADLLIDSTTVVRAIIIKEGKTSRVATSTYIFPDHVARQPVNPTGYPATWGNFSAISGIAPADYEMDPQICQSSSYEELITPALLAIPSISIVSKSDNFFSFSTDPETGGIYIHTDPPTGGLGKDWERPVSIEYLLPGSSDGFQVECGIRIHGGHSRVPEKNPKHSFRVVFRDQYGPSELKYDLFGSEATSSFNSLVLRAGFNQTWTHWDNKQREKAQYIHDSWAKDTFMKMGHTVAHNKFVHLYINGLYWGLYNLSERMDDDFMDYYLDGTREDFDVIKDYADVAEGNDEAWNQMIHMAEKGLTDPAAYYAIQGKNETGEVDESIPAYLDVENLIDYMLLNFYVGNRDWDHHNWVAARNRNAPGKGFQFIPWDSEQIFVSKSDNVVEENNENRPSYLYALLRKNPLFRKQFAERANIMLGPGGQLSPDSVLAVWDKRSKEIELAIIAESARWGDYRRDVHPYQNEPYELYTKDDFWMKEQKKLREDYFPNRSQIVLDQLKAIGLAGDVITFFPDSFDNTISVDHEIYPNPFNDYVSFVFLHTVAGFVEIDIFSLEGKRIDKVFYGKLPQGRQEINWNPSGIINGIYFYQIRANGCSYRGKLIFDK